MLGFEGVEEVLYSKYTSYQYVPRHEVTCTSGEESLFECNICYYNQLSCSPIAGIRCISELYTYILHKDVLYIRMNVS